MKKVSSLLAFLSLLLCFNNPGFTQGGERGKLYMRTAMSGNSLNISWIYLGNDGAIVRNPAAGADPIDLSKEKTLNAANTGTFVTEGNKLLISWSNGKKAEWKIEKDGGRIKGIDGGVVTQPSVMPAGYKLDGSYTASAVSANASSVNTFVFKKDGGFELKRSGTVSTDDVSSQSSDQKKGSYSISGNTLTLKFSDGTVEKALINILDIAGDKYLIINKSRFPHSRG